MQDYHCLIFAEGLQICTVVAQRQSIEQPHDQSNHDRVTAQSQLNEIGNTGWVGNRLGNGIEFPVADLYMDIPFSDNVLKPVLMGKGAPVPVLVIFLGAIGGFIFSGFVGLFTGAIILSVGYTLLFQWLEGPAGK